MPRHPLKEDEYEFKPFFRLWDRAAVGTAHVHSIIPDLVLLWDPKAETYCWSNITWRSLLPTAASAACGSLETLQTLQMKNPVISSLFFLFKGSRGTHGGRLEDSNKGTVALSFLSSHEPTVQSTLCVSHAHIISYHHLNYGQASKAEFCQQTVV